MKSRFKNISMRTSTQTQLSQVEKEYARLEKDPQRVEHEWAEICDAKEVIDSAKDMVLSNIKNHTMEVLINHYKVLMRNSQRLPVMHLVYCCEVYCKEAFDMSYDIWARALVPLLFFLEARILSFPTTLFFFFLNSLRESCFLTSLVFEAEAFS